MVRRGSGAGTLHMCGVTGIIYGGISSDIYVCSRPHICTCSVTIS